MKLDEAALEENILGALDPVIVATSLAVLGLWGLSGVAKKLVDWYYKHQMKALNKEKEQLQKELEHKKAMTETMKMAETIVATQHDDPELDKIEDAVRKAAFPMPKGGYIDLENKAFQRLLKYVESYRN